MRHNVLFVDDDTTMLESLRRALRKEPFEFVSARSGAEALLALEREDISVVVSDNHMPGMLGTEFLGVVRTKYPDTIRFMLTGEATLDVAIAAINDAAITRFFTKPFNTVDLAATIRQALEHRDLLVMTRRLTAKVNSQAALLERVEATYPGISQVRRDHGGAVIVDVTDSIEDVLREAEACFG